MALTTEEIDLCKFELGFPLTRIGAEPYVTYAAVFDKAIIPYLTDVTTFGQNSIVAAPGGALAAINVASTTGFVAGSRIVVDVGPYQELSVCVSVTTNLNCVLALAHVGGNNYPVRLQGAEYIVRDMLDRLTNVRTLLKSEAPYSAGVASSSDDVKFFGKANIGRGNMGGNRVQTLLDIRDDARDELASALGLPNLRRGRKGGGSALTLY